MRANRCRVVFRDPKISQAQNIAHRSQPSTHTSSSTQASDGEVPSWEQGPQSPCLCIPVPRWMKKPRCGVPDHPHLSRRRRNKRYALTGQKWRQKHITYRCPAPFPHLDSTLLAAEAQPGEGQALNACDFDFFVATTRHCLQFQVNLVLRVGMTSGLFYCLAASNLQIQKVALDGSVAFQPL